MTPEGPTSSRAIGSRLRAAREQAGLSQSQAAKFLRLHRPTVSQIEAGERNLKPDEITQFARLYCVRESWILSGETSAGFQADPRIELAARELSKLNKQDLDKLLDLLSTLRSSKESES